MDWLRTEDGEWVYVDVETVAVNLPAGLQDAYDAWLAAEERLSRLGFVVDGVVQDFRKAVNAAAHAVGATDAALIPLPCFRHAQMMIWYFLGVDCGYASVDDLRQGWQDSEVYLRSLYSALRMGDNRFADNTTAGSGLPRYDNSRASSSSSSGSVDSGSDSGGSTGDDGGGISYTPPPPALKGGIGG